MMTISKGYIGPSSINDHTKPCKSGKVKHKTVVIIFWCKLQYSPMFKIRNLKLSASLIFW